MKQTTFNRTLTIVLAGGEGKRLSPLTRSRAKPAVPFGGHYRLIDFALSNLTNARFLRVVVLTQYKSHSLDRHIAQSWRLSPSLGEYVVPVPAQMRTGPRWFAGSADAIFQNLNIFDDERPRHVLVFGADHVYRMDPAQMVEAHIASGAAVTVAGIQVPIAQADQFGIIDADETGRIRSFLEKPSRPPSVRGNPAAAYASMGNYVFSASALRDAVTRDAADDHSAHDVGGSIIPRLVEAGEAFVYDFGRNEVPGQDDRERGYWRDVGTIDAYHDAHMDLVSADPVFDLYNPAWPMNNWRATLPPARLVGSNTNVVDSLLCDGAVVANATVQSSVISPEVNIQASADVRESVILDGVEVGAGAVIHRAILDKNVVVPPGARIGVDPAEDRQRFHVSDGGIVVVPKNSVIQP